MACFVMPAKAVYDGNIFIHSYNYVFYLAPGSVKKNKKRRNILYHKTSIKSSRMNKRK